MSKDYNQKDYENRAGSRFAMIDDDEMNPEFVQFGGFSSRREMIFASIQNYFGNCKTMMLSSLQHLRSPVTIIVIILLIALYIILGVAGKQEFSFRINEGIREVKVSLDIIVNALLGFFYGPVTCTISVVICCLVKMITIRNGFFIGYVITAALAGFIHGWILYRHKTMWFGTRFRGFFTDLLAKSFLTRLAVSVFANILLKAIVYRIFIKIPIYYSILHYSYSSVELKSFVEFIEVFIAGLIVDTGVVFFSLVLVNFIASKAFPVQYAHPSLIIDENGALINLEEEEDEDEATS